jgi:hypothetical protein
MSAARQDMRPRVTRPTAYAASTTVVGVMMIGVMMIATMPENGAEEAAKLGERGLRLQNRGDGQSEKSEQNARRETPGAPFPSLVPLRPSSDVLSSIAPTPYRRSPLRFTAVELSLLCSRVSPSNTLASTVLIAP